MALFMVRSFPINYQNKKLKSKVDFTVFCQTDGINYTRLRGLVCGVLT